MGINPTLTDVIQCVAMLLMLILWAMNRRRIILHESKHS